MRRFWVVFWILLLPTIALAYDDDYGWVPPEIDHAAVYSGYWTHSDVDSSSGWGSRRENRLIMDVRPDGTGYQINYESYSVNKGEIQSHKISSAPFTWTESGDEIVIAGKDKYGGPFGTRFTRKEYHGSMLYSYGKTSVREDSLPYELIDRISGKWYLTAVQADNKTAEAAPYAQILTIGKDYTYTMETAENTFTGAYMVWQGTLGFDFHTGWLTKPQISDDLSTFTYWLDGVDYIYSRDGAAVAEQMAVTSLDGTYWSGTYFDGFDNEVRVGLYFRENGSVLMLRQTIGEDAYGIIERLEGTYTGDSSEIRLSFWGESDILFKYSNGAVYLLNGECIMLREDLSKIMPELLGQWELQSVVPYGSTEAVQREAFEEYNQTLGYRILYDQTYELTSDFILKRQYTDEAGTLQAFKGKYIIHNGEVYFGTNQLVLTDAGQTMTEISSWQGEYAFTRRTEKVQWPSIVSTKRTFDTAALYENFTPGAMLQTAAASQGDAQPAVSTASPTAVATAIPDEEETVSITPIPTADPTIEPADENIPTATQSPVSTPVPTSAPTQIPSPTPETEKLPIIGEVNAYQQIARSASDNSHLASSSTDYSAASVIDGDETTCWQFSTQKISLGDAMLEITLTPGSTVDELWIKNGFWRITKGLDQYTRNGRPKKIAISFRYDNGAEYRDEMEVTLRDDKERNDWQRISLGRHENVSSVRIRVISIYKGTKFKTDVAISEVMLVEREGTVPLTVYETLKRGSKGADVLAMKERLRELGYFKKNAELSDSYNDTCAERVKQFQKVNGLPQTGIADSQTLMLIYSDTALPKS